MILGHFFVKFCVNLASGGASEACGATSWPLGVSKSEFLMNFGGSRVSFWSPGATLGSSFSLLGRLFVALFCMHVFKCVLRSVFYWILEALDLQKWAFRLRGVAKNEKISFFKKSSKNDRFWDHFLVCFSPLWPLLGHFGTNFCEGVCTAAFQHHF